MIVDAVGVAVRIDGAAVSDADRAAIAAAWRDAASAATETPHVVHVPPAPRDRLLADLSQAVTREAIAAQRGRLWMLHAAGVADPHGRVVVLIGPSGRGKTTASRALARHFGYVSDETVAVDETGRVFAYRKPLSVIERPDDPGAPKAQHAPSDLALRPLPEGDLRLAAIALLERDPDGPDEPELETCDIIDALTEIVTQTSYLVDLPHGLLAVARHAAAVGGVRRIRYREAETLAPAVARLFEQGAQLPPPHLPATAPAPPVRVEGTVYRRVPEAQAVQLDDPDRIALLHVDAAGIGTVRALAGIGPVLWRAASGVPLAELAEAAVAAFGAPEEADAGALVQRTLDQLVDADILTTGDVWSIDDDVAWTDDGARVMVLPLAAQDVRALEGSAAMIWRALGEGPATTGGLVGRVARAADADPALISGDVATFLTRLAEEGLVAREA